MRKKFVVNIIVFAVSFAVGAGILYWVIRDQGVTSIWEHISVFGFLPFLGFVFISMLNFALYSIRWQLILNKQLPKNQPMSLWRIYWHRMTGFAVSYLTPAAQVGGEPARIAMLGTDKVPIRTATSSVILDIAFELAAYFTFIVAGVCLAVLGGLGNGESFLLILGGMLALLGVLIVFFWRIARGKGFFAPAIRTLRIDRIQWFNKRMKPLIEMEEMMTTFLRGRYALVFSVALLSMLVISFRVVEVFYISWFFGVQLTFSQAFLMSTLPGIALVLPVPGGVGVFEGSFALIFSLLAIPLNPVSFALVIRGRDLLFITMGSLHMLRQGSGFVRERLLRSR